MRSKSAARLPGTVLLATCPEVAVQKAERGPHAHQPSCTKPFLAEAMENARGTDSSHVLLAERSFLSCQKWGTEAFLRACCPQRSPLCACSPPEGARSPPFS